ncbi:hypothetical protein T4B_10858 [Trichinella pseudospiralis]|uniref:Uncharacterized protein n=1 Tax=Trichinella pseudospiralis TaxID=6337 RepID=A0A0V1H0K8_TRIPS|nr:hypothetical protein T4B_10858 [Trichinella pseudospiralis]
MPLGRCQAAPAKNSRAARRSDNRRAGLRARGDGFRRSPVCKSDQEDHGTEIRVSNHMYGLPHGAFRASPGNVNSQSDASSPTLYSLAWPAGYNSDG